MGDIAGGFLGKAVDVLKQNPAAAGGIGALAGAMMGRGRPMGGALGGVAMGLLSMIAMNALRRQSQGPSQGAGDPAPAPPATAPAPASMPPEELALLTVRSMIMAAKADGQIDQSELDAIMGKLDEHQLGAEEQRWVLDQMRKPVDLDGLVGEVRDQTTAVQVYAAALLAIDVDTPLERQYMASLAQKLSLPPAVTAAVHEQLEVAQTSPAEAAAPTTGGVKNPWQS
jgi:uncharacterized membrane protein YebE (DUF533 family)